MGLRKTLWAHRKRQEAEFIACLVQSGFIVEVVCGLQARVTSYGKDAGHTRVLAHHCDAQKSKSHRASNTAYAISTAWLWHVRCGQLGLGVCGLWGASQK